MIYMIVENDWLSVYHIVALLCFVYNCSLHESKNDSLV